MPQCTPIHHNNKKMKNIKSVLRFCSIPILGRKTHVPSPGDTYKCQEPINMLGSVAAVNLGMDRLMAANQLTLR
jgi:hypothetical protein